MTAIRELPRRPVVFMPVVVYAVVLVDRLSRWVDRVLAGE